MTRPARRRDDAGMVTAELATVAPFGLVLLVLMVWIVSLGLTQVRLTDAAREGARLVARGEPDRVASTAARRHAPDGSTVRITRERDTVVVRVTSRSRPPLPFFSGIGTRSLAATSTAVLESP